MVGDMLMHKYVVDTGERKDPDGNSYWNFDHLFAHVKDEVERADLAIVNQETILGGRELNGFTGYPTFNSPYELADAEVRAGFDVILHGTNHALDRSARGIENCLKYWKSAHPKTLVLGIHDSAEDQKIIRIVTVKGMKLAILNYTYGTNGIQMPGGKGYLVDYLSEQRVRDDILRAEAAADLTIVCPHWGTEYRLTVSADQKKWMQLFLESGADLVIGTHPHVIEPVVWESDDQGNRMLVYYSLGNFVNSTATWREGVMQRMVGGMAEITLSRDPAGHVRISDYTVRPVVNHIVDRPGEKLVTAYFLDEYTQELAEESRVKKQDPTFSLEACYRLVEQVWPGVYDKRRRKGYE